MTGIFQETGLLGMIEASDYDPLGSISSFIVEILEVCCGNLKSTDVTK